MGKDFTNPAPRKITLEEWSHQFRGIDEALIKKFKYYNNAEWGVYLSPPATFMVYGARELKRLKFDNSLAALRMWGFVFNESERLFRARQAGKKVMATMGDLGIVPTIVLAFPGCIPFYPECIWWTPFFKESTELLDVATRLGAPEATCFSRAALSAFYKKSYFPELDLLIASTGASCDDYSCVMQLIEDLGYKPLWIEIPFRRTHQKYHLENDYPKRFEDYLIKEYRRVWDRLVQITGIDEPERLTESIKKANQLRDLVAKIKQLACTAGIAPLPALELMTVEFGNMYGYADFDEWIKIVGMIYETTVKRAEKGTGVLSPDAVPIAWVTPSADPYLLNLVEDLGGRVTETEYVINQALVKIEENIEPFRALARACYQASLIGSTEERVKRIKETVKKGQIKGVLITNMLGASHCSMESRLIEKMLGDVPVLSIDVPAPFGITEQIRMRLTAFMETIK